MSRRVIATCHVTVSGIVPAVVVAVTVVAMAQAIQAIVIVLVPFQPWDSVIERQLIGFSFSAGAISYHSLVHLGRAVLSRRR